MPLKVHIANPSKSIGIPDYYIRSVKQSLNDWSSSIDGTIKFEYVNLPALADIHIRFVPQIDKSGASEGFIAGLTKPFLKGNRLEYVTVTFSEFKPDNSLFNETEFYNTSLHEFGHVLGIWGHSENKNDIMNAIAHKEFSKTKRTPTQRDLNTLKLLYKLDPDVSNSDSAIALNKESAKNESVLGTMDLRLKTKLEEAKAYTQKASYSPISWRQLGDAYANMNDYKNAIESYNKSLSIDGSFIESREGLAHAYFKSNDFVNTVLQYQKLISAKPANIDYSYNLAYVYFKNQKYSESKNVISAILVKNSKSKDDEKVKNLINRLEEKTGKASLNK
jgi:tetratricopeptide (TPR) repeat protein